MRNNKVQIDGRLLLSRDAQIVWIDTGTDDKSKQDVSGAGGKTPVLVARVSILAAGAILEMPVILVGKHALKAQIAWEVAQRSNQCPRVIIEGWLLPGKWGVPVVPETVNFLLTPNHLKEFGRIYAERQALGGALASSKTPIQALVKALAKALANGKISLVSARGPRDAPPKQVTSGSG